MPAATLEMADSFVTPYDGLCPWCKEPMSVGALLCVKCGYHLKLRTKVQVEPEPSLAAVRDPANPYRTAGLQVTSQSPTVGDRLRTILSRLSIRGRMPRWQWWLFQLGGVVLIALIGSLKERQLLPDDSAISMPIVLGILIYSHAKRWHDMNHSAWWVLLHLIPMGSLYSFVVLGFGRGTYGPNRYGPDPSDR